MLLLNQVMVFEEMLIKHNSFQMRMYIRQNILELQIKTSKKQSFKNDLKPKTKSFQKRQIKCSTNVKLKLHLKTL